MQHGFILFMQHVINVLYPIMHSCFPTKIWCDSFSSSYYLLTRSCGNDSEVQSPHELAGFFNKDVSELCKHFRVGFKETPPSPLFQLSSENELDLLSLLPKGWQPGSPPSTQPCVLMPSTWATFLARRYRFIIELDLSPSTGIVVRLGFPSPLAMDQIPTQFTAWWSNSGGAAACGSGATQTWGMFQFKMTTGSRSFSSLLIKVYANSAWRFCSTIILKTQVRAPYFLTDVSKFINKI